MRRLAGLVLVCAASVGVLASSSSLARTRGAAVAARSRTSSSVTLVVAARRHRAAAAALAVRRAGGRVVIRRGRLLQVRLPRGRAARVRRAPGVAGVGPAQVGWADQVVSQGVYRTGADSLQSAGVTGAGVRVAVLDMGFGSSWQDRLGTELPPASRIDATMSFDKTTAQPGIAGLNANSQPTSHGESVAEVVHDMAPGARLTLVNYHTELEFVSAVDWLIAGPGGVPRVDIVVHSNSFLDGPFDGTGIAAQAVDRARAAGILWVNSAGNYAQRHWEGAVGDVNADGWADIGPAGALDFPLAAGAGMGATLYWSSCLHGHATVDPTSVSYQIDVTESGSSSPVVYAEGQRDATRPLSTVGWASTLAGTYSLRVRQLTPGVACNLEIFGGGVELGALATASSSIPTPGDAKGSLTVGAVDWHDDSLAPYSSQGPTEDGRVKPDLVAPASTSVWPGVAMVGTSASAPHVAGAAALLVEQDRANHLPSDPSAVTAQLESSALDIGTPGLDTATGYGRLRLDVSAPRILQTSPTAGASVHGTVPLSLQVADDGTLQGTGVSVDGVAVGQAVGAYGAPYATTTLADGPHVATFWATDMAGNRSELQVPFSVDNTAPVLSPAGPLQPGSSLVLVVRDADARGGTALVTVLDSGGLVVRSRRVPLQLVGGLATLRIRVPAAGPGPYRVRVQAVDAAGNSSAPFHALVRARRR